MGAFLISALGLGKNIAGAALAFLAKLNPWQLACLAFALWMLVVQLEWADARHDRDAWKKQDAELHRQLDALSTEKNRQQTVTKDRIVTVTRTIKQADDSAKRIETAPLPPTNCHGATPKEVLDAPEL